MGPDLMEQMREQAKRFGAELRAEDVETVDLAGPVKTVTANGQDLPGPRRSSWRWGAAARYLGLSRGSSSCSDAG